MESFRHIGLLGRITERKVLESLQQLLDFLNGRGVQVLLQEDVATALNTNDAQVASIEVIGQTCDLAIVVGGDGSLLGAARVLAQYDVPLLGVNRGRLGFLTDIKPREIEQKVGAILDGDYLLEQRFLLDAALSRNGETIGNSEAVNDVVLGSGTSARMIEYELFVEGQFVYSQSSDGVIVSTPTGSTAYALSGGGPIMHPKVDAIVLVPMFPHTLSSRPIVVDANSEIKIVIGANNPTNPQLSCDGQVNFSAAPGDSVFIRKRSHDLKLVHPVEHNYYAACRDKLGWGSRLRSNEDDAADG